MEWWALSGFSAIFTAISIVSLKRLSVVVSTIYLGWLVSIGLDIPALLWYVDYSTLSIMLQKYWPHLLATGVLNALAMITLLKAIELAEISYVSPILCLFPALSIITSTVFLNEQLSAIGAFGVVLTTIGVYFLSLKPGMSASYPLTRIWTDLGAKLAFATPVLWSISVFFDKVAMKEVDSTLWMLGIYVIDTTLLGLYFFSTRPEKFKLPKQILPMLFVFGLSGLLANVLHMEAVKQTIVSYPIAVRQFNVVFVVLIGVFWMKESFTYGKFLGTGCLLSSVYFISF